MNTTEQAYTHEQLEIGAIELRAHFDKAGVLGYGTGISRKILSVVLDAMGFKLAELHPPT